MSETTSETGQEGGAKGKDLLQEETSAEGRYIPYGGGSLGWFENSGVPKCERGNDYKFHTAIDTAKVRQKLFERWGDDVNRRMETRFDVERPTPVKITWEGETHEAETKDLSMRGLRLQLTEDTGLKNGDKITVHVFRRPNFEEEVLTLAAEIMWVARVGKRRQVWNVGIGFTEVDEATGLKLKEFLLK
jgi:hypothetical protein